MNEQSPIPTHSIAKLALLAYYPVTYIFRHLLPMDQIESACFRISKSKAMCDVISTDSMPNLGQAVLFTLMLSHYYLQKEIRKSPQLDHIIPSSIYAVMTTIFLRFEWEELQATIREHKFNHADFRAESIGALVGGYLFIYLAKSRAHLHHGKS